MYLVGGLPKYAEPPGGSPPPQEADPPPKEADPPGRRQTPLLGGRSPQEADSPFVDRVSETREPTVSGIFKNTPLVLVLYEFG